jgi:hypothetical protein
MAVVGWGRDLTFVVASDLHYGCHPPAEYREHIARINALPGTAYPNEVGGKVGPISAVILNGDLTQKFDGSIEQWSQFTNDWGVCGERLCKFRVYEGFGNHDGPPGGLVREGIRERNKTRPGLTNISPNGLHYSWDMDGVHFIQANLVAADDATTERSFGPEGALSFVESDLEKYVGASGRPVVLSQHLSPKVVKQAYWSDAERAKLAKLLSKYNVIGVFTGHSHGMVWTGPDATGTNVPDSHYEHEKFLGSSIDQYNDGSLTDDGNKRKRGSSRLLVVHITDTKMTVIMNTVNGWGQPYVKPISSGAKSPAVMRR